VIQGAVLLPAGVYPVAATKHMTACHSPARIIRQTLLTVILNRQAAPVIIQRTEANLPQMVIDFPQARAGVLPPEQFGDGVLVKRVLTRVSPSGRGVQIIVEFKPHRAYTWRRQSRPLKGGHIAFMVGFKAAGPPAPAQGGPPSPAPPPVAAPPPAPQPEPRWTPPPPGPPSLPPPSGGFAELRYLVPQATALWQFLEKDGWVVTAAKDYDRPGKRFSRAFTLINPQFPEAVINVAHIPANSPGAPDINVVDLDFERLNSPTAREYREMKKWNIAKIKKKFEDIGDFFDDGLKPLRVKLRRECQELALSRAAFLQEYLRHAAPQQPRVAEEVLRRIKAKVNPRFEGVQFTIAENPLLILNLVDFLYIRTYYLGGGHV